MSIRDTYAELVVEQIIQDILAEAQSPSTAEITNRFAAFEDENDLSKPLFLSDNFQVAYGEVSSITKWNQQNSEIQRDLKVLYKHLFKVSDQAINNFERWRSEAALLDKRLDQLEDRITSLLLVTSDTAGYFNFMQDNFTDTTKVNLAESDAYVNVAKGLVQIGTSALGPTRRDTSHLTDNDITFTILSLNSLVSHVASPGSRTKYVVSDVNNFWQERVHTNKPGPVSIELKVDLKEAVEISRIDVDLHQANANSVVQVTPMLSTDNYNFIQLPSSTFTRDIIDKAIFQFAPTVARYIKFILTKTGFDLTQQGIYTYEFGVDEISFYNEGFEQDDIVTLISKPLSVLDDSGLPQQFSKIVLEVCEDVPAGTSLNYYVAATNNPNDAISNLAFVAIDPVDREITTNPTVLDFGELDAVEVPNVSISYDITQVSGVFINPGREYTVIENTSGTMATTVSGAASAMRYAFENSNERTLDYVLASGINIAQGTLEIWRNVNTVGDDTLVRDEINGWGFEDPYYTTTVYVNNAEGVDIDFGGKAVIIDGVSTTGKINISNGRHLVWVHKDNWKSIDQNYVTDLTTLKTEDPLYPYNHRYLVEGFDYPVGYPINTERVYMGFDIVAECLMQEVSIFDLSHNVASDDYGKFAIDWDGEDPNATEEGVPTPKESMRTIVLKVDENNPDFVNEKFLLRFKAARSLFSYIVFKAVLQTTDETITPFLDSYRIKISS